MAATVEPNEEFTESGYVTNIGRVTARTNIDPNRIISVWNSVLGSGASRSSVNAYGAIDLAMLPMTREGVHRLFLHRCWFALWYEAIFAEHGLGHEDAIRWALACVDENDGLYAPMKPVPDVAGISLAEAVSFARLGGFKVEVQTEPVALTLQSINGSPYLNHEIGTVRAVEFDGDEVNAGDPITFDMFDGGTLTLRVITGIWLDEGTWEPGENFSTHMANFAKWGAGFSDVHALHEDYDGEAWTTPFGDSVDLTSYSPGDIVFVSQHNGQSIGQSNRFRFGEFSTGSEHSGYVPTSAKFDVWVKASLMPNLRGMDAISELGALLIDSGIISSPGQLVGNYVSSSDAYLEDGATGVICVGSTPAGGAKVIPGPYQFIFYNVVDLT